MCAAAASLGHADDIRNTDVLETWFIGKEVRAKAALRTRSEA
jgi:hypothetical protein